MFDEIVPHGVTDGYYSVGVLGNGSFKMRNNFRTSSSTSSPLCTICMENYGDFSFVLYN